MRMRAINILVFAVIGFSTLSAQNNSISGTVIDNESREKLISAHIVDIISQSMTVTDKQGFFHLILPENQQKVDLTVSYVGYDNYNKTIDLPISNPLLMGLNSGTQLEEVTVLGKRRETGSELIKLNSKTINSMPQVLGETDLLRTYQYFPGVLPSDESKNSLYVRGGSPDQNQILIDGVPAFYLYHIGNLTSTFNPDIINDVAFYKGGFDPKYGGRLSSIIDVSMKDGNKDHLSGGFQIGMISSRVNIQGPLGNNKKTSFILSSRAFYSPFLALFKSPIRYEFQDHFFKVHHDINSRSAISFFTFLTHDAFKAVLITASNGSAEKNYFKTAWNNQLFSGKWDYRFNNSISLSTQIYRSSYDFRTEIHGDQIEPEYHIENGNNLFANGIDCTLTHYGKLKTQVGIEAKMYDFETGTGLYRDFIGGINRTDSIISGFQQQPIETSLFFGQEVNLTGRLSGQWGIRGSVFYSGGSHVSLEPRLNIKYQLTESVDMTLSASRMSQALHLVNTSYSEMPNDVWLAATPELPPEIAKQISGGFSLRPKKNHQIDLTAYYKKMTRLVYLNQSLPILVGNWVDKTGLIYRGEGESYGLEGLYQIKGNKLSGWLSLTLSKTTRKYDGLNEGNPFPAWSDRPVFVATNWVYSITEKISISAQWFYGSGKPLTLPEQKYFDETYRKVLFEYSSINSQRMKPIHRLDAGVNLSKKKPKGTRTWNFSIVNLYNRMNPYYYSIGFGKDRETGNYYIKSEQQSFFFITPSLSYRFVFD